jgi:hypothetical protein
LNLSKHFKYWNKCLEDFKTKYLKIHKFLSRSF